MRSVIMKPLTILVAASASATVAKSKTRPSFGSDMTIKAATMDTEEMALVSAIKGV